MLKTFVPICKQPYSGWSGSLQILRSFLNPMKYKLSPNYIIHCMHKISLSYYFSNCIRTEKKCIMGILSMMGFHIRTALDDDDSGRVCKSASRPEPYNHMRFNLTILTACIVSPHTPTHPSQSSVTRH